MAKDTDLRKDKPLISIVEAWKTYMMGEVEVHALRGLNLDIFSNEFIAIQGPSGSGKSTAMNLVGCLDVPTRGHIYLDGEDISLMEESELAQIRGRKIGFIFQKFNLINTLTALENVMLPLTFQGKEPEERAARARKLLKMVDLGDRMNHKPTEMSGGQQQRVAIARAMAVDPDIILADEPTGNLDSKMGDTVMSFLEDLNNKHGKTIIMVTHDDKLARHAHRIEHLMDGSIVRTSGKKR
ncbi:MAG: ABC transporter ATP-binding protein [Candidatus Woesearchaeota archaeon]